MANDTYTLKIKVDDKGRPIIKRLRTDLKAMGIDVKKLTEKSKKQFGGMWMQMLKGQVVFAGLRKAQMLVSNAVRSLTKDLIDFDSEFQNVTTLLDDGQEVTFNMKEELLDMAGALGSTTELTKGLYMALSASVEPAKAVEFVGVAAKFAKAGLTDMAASVDVLTTILNAYGLEAEDAARVSDVLFQTVKDGKITGQQLASSLGVVINTAAIMGVELEEVTAAVASLTKVGVPAQTAMVALNQTMMAIIKPTEQAAEAAKGLTYEFSKAGIKEAGGFQQFLVQLKKDIGDNEKALATLFPNVRALKAIFPLTGKAAADYSKEMVKMTKVENNVNIAFEKNQRSISAMADAIKNELSAAFQKTLLPHLETLKKFITDNKTEIIAFGKSAINTMIGFGEALFNTIKLVIKFKDVLLITAGVWAAGFALTKVIAWGKAMGAVLIATKAKMLLMNVALQSVITNFKFLRVMGSGVFNALNQSISKGLSGMGVFGKTVAVAGAAFAGWEIGRLIGELTGLDRVVENVASGFLKLTGLLYESTDTTTNYTKATVAELNSLKELAGIREGEVISLLQVSRKVKENTLLYSQLSKSHKQIVDQSLGLTKAASDQVDALADQAKALKDTEKELNRLNKTSSLTEEQLKANLKILKQNIKNEKKYYQDKLKQLEKIRDIYKEIDGYKIDSKTPELGSGTFEGSPAEMAKSGGGKLPVKLGLFKQFAKDFDDMKLDGKVAIISDAFKRLGVEADSAFGQMLQGAENFAMIASKNIMGGVMGLIGTFAGLFSNILFDGSRKRQTEREDRSKSIANAQRANEAAMLSWEQAEKLVDGTANLSDLIAENFNGMLNAAGGMTEDILNYVRAIGQQGQLTADMLDDITSKLEDNQKKIDDLKASGLAMALEGLKGLGDGKLADSIRDSIAAAYAGQGKTTSEIVDLMGDEAPEAMKKFVEENKKVLDKTDALSKAMAGLGRAGLMTSEQFRDMQNQAYNYYQQLLDNGVSEADALKAILPLLAQSKWLSEQKGEKLSDNTKKLIEQAEAAGYNLDDQISAEDRQLAFLEKQTELLQQLIDIFAKTLPDAMQNTSDANEKMFNDMADNQKDYNNENPWGDGNDGESGGNWGGSKDPYNDEAPGFAEGANFTVPSGFENDSYPMRVSSGEHVNITPKGKSGTKSNTTNVFNLELPNVTNINAVRQLKDGLLNDELGIRTDLENLGRA